MFTKCIALLPIILKVLQGLCCGSELKCFGYKVGVAHVHYLCNALKGRIYTSEINIVFAHKSS